MAKATKKTARKAAAKKTAKKKSRARKTTPALTVPGGPYYRLGDDSERICDFGEEQFVYLQDFGERFLDADGELRVPERAIDAWYEALPKAEYREGFVEPEEPNSFNNMGFGFELGYAPELRKALVHSYAAISTEFDEDYVIDDMKSADEAAQHALGSAEDAQAYSDGY